MKTRSWKTVKMSHKTSMAFLFTDHVQAITRAENRDLMMHRIGLLSAFMWPKADYDYQCDEEEINDDFAKQIKPINANTPTGASKIQHYQFQHSIKTLRALYDLANRIGLVGEEYIEDDTKVPADWEEVGEGG